MPARDTGVDTVKTWLQGVCFNLSKSSAIIKAVRAGNYKDVCLACQYPHDDIDRREPGSWCTALMIACGQGFAKAVRELLARGANTKLCSRDNKHALHYAVMSGNLECCKALMRWKCNPEELVHCKDKAGKTPLDYCPPERADIAPLLSQAVHPRAVCHNTQMSC